jgi:hydrogenase nickel incorporation protein HypA/HybF
MHEYSLAKALIEQVRDIASGRGAQKVIEIVVEAGPLSGIEPILMATAFERLTARSELHGARLTIQSVPLTIRCHACGVLSALEESHFVCPSCESTTVQVLSGDRVVLLHVELGMMEASEVAP